MVQTYRTKPLDQCVWEAHRKYIDVQYLYAGTEVMGWAPLAGAAERVAYDPARDVAFYDPPKDVTLTVVPAGTFAIFFPTDVHMPQAAHGVSVEIGKIVVKVAVE
jgi:YhcH/YjgK/YiaL family protein